jgi:hypothetical protein
VTAPTVSTTDVSASGNVDAHALAVTAGATVGGTLNVAGAATTNGLTNNGALTVTNGDLMVYRSGGASGVVFLTNTGTRYLYYDGTNYQMPGGQLVGISDPTTGNAAATKHYADDVSGFISAGRVRGTDGALLATKGSVTPVLSSKSSAQYVFSVPGITANAIVTITQGGTGSHGSANFGVGGGLLYVWTHNSSGSGADCDFSFVVVAL